MAINAMIKENPSEMDTFENLIKAGNSILGQVKFKIKNKTDLISVKGNIVFSRTLLDFCKTMLEDSIKTSDSLSISIKDQIVLKQSQESMMLHISELSEDVSSYADAELVSMIESLKASFKAYDERLSDYITIDDWDVQMHQDINNGLFDGILAEVKKDIKNGKAKLL